jgi:hypothetical protein
MTGRKRPGQKGRLSIYCVMPLQFVYENEGKGARAVAYHNSTHRPIHYRHLGLLDFIQ